MTKKNTKKNRGAPSHHMNTRWAQDISLKKTKNGWEALILNTKDRFESVLVWQVLSHKGVYVA